MLDSLGFTALAAAMPDGLSARSGGFLPKPAPRQSARQAGARSPAPPLIRDLGLFHAPSPRA